MMCLGSLELLGCFRGCFQTSLSHGSLVKAQQKLKFRGASWPRHNVVIWLERNNRIFKNHEEPVHVVYKKAKDLC